jgi:hypothetical protein
VEDCLAGALLADAGCRGAVVLEKGHGHDEFFVECGAAGACTGSLRRGAWLAARLRAAVREGAGFVTSAGVGRSKLLAKLAAGLHKPDGLSVAWPEEESAGRPKNLEKATTDDRCSQQQRWLGVTDGKSRHHADEEEEEEEEVGEGCWPLSSGSSQGSRCSLSLNSVDQQAVASPSLGRRRRGGYTSSPGHCGAASGADGSDDTGWPDDARCVAAEAALRRAPVGAIRGLGSVLMRVRVKIMGLIIIRTD